MPARMMAAWERTAVGNGRKALAGATGSLVGGEAPHEQPCIHATSPWRNNRVRPTLPLLVLPSESRRNCS